MYLPGVLFNWKRRPEQAPQKVYGTYMHFVCLACHLVLVPSLGSVGRMGQGAMLSVKKVEDIVENAAAIANWHSSRAMLLLGQTLLLRQRRNDG